MHAVTVNKRLLNVHSGDISWDSRGAMNSEILETTVYACAFFWGPPSKNDLETLFWNIDINTMNYATRSETLWFS